MNIKISILLTLSVLFFSCKKNYNCDCKNEANELYQKAHYINKIEINGVDSTSFYEPCLNIEYRFGTLQNEAGNFMMDINHQYGVAEYLWTSSSCNQIKIHTHDQSGTNYLLASSILPYNVEWDVANENGIIVTTNKINGKNFKLFWGQSSIAPNCDTSNCCLSLEEKGYLNFAQTEDTLRYKFNNYDNSENEMRFSKKLIFLNDSSVVCNSNIGVIYNRIFESFNSNILSPKYIDVFIFKLTRVYLSVEIGDGENNFIFCDSLKYFNSPPEVINGISYDHVLHLSFPSTYYSEVLFNKDYGIIAFTYKNIRFERKN